MTGSLLGTPHNASELREIQIELTERCDADCPFCINRATFATHGRSYNGLATAVLEDVIAWIADAGIGRVRFTGGEPLLRKDVGHLASYARAKALVTGINTNGHLVNRWAERLFEDFDFVLLSIISAKPERTDEIMRFAGSHTKKLQALSLLSGHPNLWVSTVLTRESIDELPQIADLLCKYDVQRWIWLRPEDNANTANTYSFGPRELSDLLKAARELSQCKFAIALGNAVPVCGAERADDQALLEKLLLSGSGGLVSEGRSKLVIDPKGRVLVHYGIDRQVGNIFDDLEALWHTPFAEEMRSIEIVPTACRGCFYLETCNGGSRLAARAAYGSFARRDPLMTVPILTPRL